MILSQFFDPASAIPLANTATLVAMYLMLNRRLQRLESALSYERGKENEKRRESEGW
jgi:hypothetical protein